MKLKVAEATISNDEDSTDTLHTMCAGCFIYRQIMIFMERDSEFYIYIWFSTSFDMHEVNVTILETLPDGKELGHSITMPGYLLPAVGDQIHLFDERARAMMRITEKKIVALPDKQFHVGFTAIRLEE